MVSEAIHANFPVQLLEKLTIVGCDSSESSVLNFLLEKMVAHDNQCLAEERRLLTSRMLAMKKYVRFIRVLNYFTHAVRLLINNYVLL